MLRLSRIWAMAVKELKVVLLDKRARVTLLAAPIFQLGLFGMASTLEVSNIDIGIVNRDNGVAAEQLLAALDGSHNIRSIRYFADNKAMNQAIDARQIIAGLVVPPDLSAKIARGDRGEIGLVLDGRRINSAQIVASYLMRIAGDVGARVQANWPAHQAQMPQLEVRHWFNPNLIYRWFSLPGLVALVVATVVNSVAVQAIARERELGTFDELMVLPLSSAEVLIGKMIPAFLVGVFNASLYAALIPLIYGVPFHGSWLLLLAAIVSFSLVITGMGLSISAVTQNQQQAFLGGFLMIVPVILLSGYASPVDNMAPWLRYFASINPLYHMLIICQGIFLKDMSVAVVMAHIWPMLLVAFGCLILAGKLFRTHAE
ncbi:MAG: hypothetical protein RLY97_1034 [Pseudomonadota bacterium]|jgi:ABC-2 type transport system permease protein